MIVDDCKAHFVNDIYSVTVLAVLFLVSLVSSPLITFQTTLVKHGDTKGTTAASFACCFLFFRIKSLTCTLISYFNKAWILFWCMLHYFIMFPLWYELSCRNVCTGLF